MVSDAANPSDNGKGRGWNAHNEVDILLLELLTLRWSCRDVSWKGSGIIAKAEGLDGLLHTSAFKAIACRVKVGPFLNDLTSQTKQNRNLVRSQKT